MIFICLKRLRLKIISPLRVVPKWSDSVLECFRGVRGVSVGRIRVSEDVWLCFVVLVVSSVVFGCLEVMSWVIFRVSKLPGGVLGCL